MIRVCDLCANPPTYKCGSCQSEMIEPAVKVPTDLWWPRVVYGRSIVNGSSNATPPPDFLYV